MQKEKTQEEKIEEAVSEVKNAMMEHLKASKAETEAVLAKQKAHYKLQSAKDRLYALESELIAL